MDDQLHFIIDWTNANGLRDLLGYIDEEGTYIEVTAKPPETENVENIETGEMEKLEYSGRLDFYLNRKTENLGIEPSGSYMTAGSFTLIQADVHEASGHAIPDWFEWRDEEES